jgi:hypothetical protein
MKVSKLITKVYRDHVKNYGEPDKSIRFGNGTCIEGEEHIPSIIDILIWLPDKDVDITTFATIGMSDKPMSEVDYRAELHFAIRANLEEKEIAEVSAFLANIAVHPFLHRTYLDWYHIINPEEIPQFKDTTSILFFSAFVDGGWETIQADKQTVKILNLIPITAQEKEIVKNQGVNALLTHLETEKIDMFLRK